MKSYLLRKKKDAVSPVIATILMVAITVVLAAVLYVMVMGFGGGSNNTPSASFNYQKTTSGNYTFTMASVSSNSVKFADIQVIVTPNGTLPAIVVNPTTGITPGMVGSTFCGAGDYFTIANMVPNTQYSITVKYIPTGGSMYSVNLAVS